MAVESNETIRVSFKLSYGITHLVHCLFEKRYKIGCEIELNSSKLIGIGVDGASCDLLNEEMRRRTKCYRCAPKCAPRFRCKKGGICSQLHCCITGDEFAVYVDSNLLNRVDL